MSSTALQLAGPDTEPGQTPVQLEPGRLAADVQQRDHLVTFHRLDHRAARAGERLAALRDHSHDRLGVESRRG